MASLADVTLDIVVRTSLDATAFTAQRTLVDKALADWATTDIIGDDAFAGLATAADAMQGLQRELASIGAIGAGAFDRVETGAQALARNAGDADTALAGVVSAIANVGRDGLDGLSGGLDAAVRDAVDMQQATELLQRELARIGGISTVDAVADDLHAAGRAGDDLLDAMRKLERELAGLAEAADVDTLAADFNRAQQETRNLVSAQESALAALVAAGEEGSAAYVDLVAEIITARAELDRLDSAQAHVRQLFDEPITPHLEPPEQSTLEKFLGLEALEKLGGFLDGVAERGKEYNATIKELAGQTGLLGDELDAVAERGQAAFGRGIGENLAEATKVIGFAQQQLGKVLDPAGMDAFVQRAAGIGRVFDVDVNEVIGKGRTLVTQFGLGGKEAGDLIAYTMQGANNATGDVLDTLDEYSQHLKIAGYNAGEFTGILVRGVQAGARDTDKLGDAIKETTIRLKAGDTSAALQGISSPITASIKSIVALGEQGKLSVKEVLGQATAEIENAFKSGTINEQVRSQLQVAIAGTPGEDIGSDLFGRIFSAPIDLNAVTDAATTAGTQMADVIEPTFTDRISRMFSAVGDKVSGLFAPAAAAAGKTLGVVGQIGPALSFLGDSKLLPVDKLGSLLGKLGDIPAIASKAGPALSGVFTAATGPIGLVVLGVGAAAAALAYFFTSTEKGKAAWDDISTAAENFWALIKPILSDVGDILLDIGELAWEVMITPFELAVEVIGGVVEMLVDAAGALIELVGGGSDATKLFTNLEEVFSLVKISIDGVIGGFRALKDGVLDVIERLLDFDITGAIEAGKQLGDRMVSGFNTAAADGLADKAIDRMADAIKRRDDLTIKIKASADTRGLIADYEAAQGQIAAIQKAIATASAAGDTGAVNVLTEQLREAQNAAAGIGDKLQAAAPSAVSGIRTMTDASGKFRTVYDINTGSLKKQLDAQDKAYGAQAKAELVSYGNQLGQLSVAYGAQREELTKLQDRINNGTATQAEIDRFNELVGAVNDTRNGMMKAFEDGARAGLLTDASIKQVARALGISEDEARRMATQIKEAPKAAADGKKNIDELGQSFGAAMQKAQQEVDRLQAAYAEMLRTGQTDPAIINQLRSAQTELAKLNEIQKVAARTPQEIAAAAAEKQAARDERAIRRYEAEQQRAIQRIADQDEAKRRSIDLDEELAKRRADAEIRHQSALARAASLGSDSDAAAQARQAAADAALDRSIAIQDAKLAREQLAGEIAQRNAQRAIDAATKTAEAETALLAGRLQRLRDSGAASVAALQEQQRLELDVLQHGVAQQQRAQIEQSAAFTQFKDQLLAQVAVTPSITPEQVVRQLTEKRAAIAAQLDVGTDPISLAYQEIARDGARQEAQIRADAVYAIEEARIRALPDALDRELGVRLLAARKALDAEIQAAGDSEALKAEARATFQREQDAIEEERAVAREADLGERTRAAARLQARRTLAEKLAAARDDAAAQEAARREFLDAEMALEKDYAQRRTGLAVAVGLITTRISRAFISEISDDRRADLEQQKRANADQLADLEVSLAQGTIALEEYYNRRAELARSNAELEQGLGKKTYDYIGALNSAGATAFKDSTAALTEQAANLGKEFGALSLKSATELEALGLTTDDVTGKMGAAFLSAGAAATTAAVQVALEGKNVIQGFADATLDIVAKTLEGQIPALIALIFGNAFAKDPIFGAITAGVATAALYGLVALARTALSNAKSRAQGGLVDGPKQLIWVNDDEQQRPEYVVRGEATARELPVLEHINRGGGLRDYVRQHSAELLGTDGDTLYVDPNGILQAGFEQADALSRVAQRTAQALQDLERIEQHLHARHDRHAVAEQHWQVIVASEGMLAEMREQTTAIREQTVVLSGALNSIHQAVQQQHKVIPDAFRALADRLARMARQRPSASVDDILNALATAAHNDAMR